MAFLTSLTPTCNTTRQRHHRSGLAYLPLQPSPLSYSAFNWADSHPYPDDTMNLDGFASVSKLLSSSTSSGSSSFVLSSSPLKQSHSTFSYTRRDERRRAYKSTASRRTTTSHQHASNASGGHAHSSSSPYHRDRTTGPRISPAATGAHDRPHFKFIEETARRARSHRDSIVDSRRNGLKGDLIRDDETDEELANLRRQHLRDERSRILRAQQDLSSDDIRIQDLAEESSEQANAELPEDEVPLEVIYEADELPGYPYEGFQASRDNADDDRTIGQPPSLASEDSMYDDDIDMDLIHDSASPTHGADSAMLHG